MNFLIVNHLNCRIKRFYPRVIICVSKCVYDVSFNACDVYVLYKSHYENLSMQGTEIFSQAKIENFIGKVLTCKMFAQNIDCW